MAMRWSWKLGTVARIRVDVHATFLILLAWVAYAHWRDARSVLAVVSGIAFILAIFTCIVLHELGHALAARRYGIRTRDITLLPIGGVARLERMPEDPRQELVVAFAGPAVNVLIAGLLWAWLALSDALVGPENLGLVGGPFLQRLLAVNLFLVAFNLIPAFPMDGGRVLRALLALRMEYTRATHIAARAGQFLAYGFGFLGLLYNPFLLFIAFFVWIGAAQEAAMVQMRRAVGGIPVSRVMITDFRVVAPGDPLQFAVDLTLATAQKDFPVVDGEDVVGVLTQGDLLAALQRAGAQARIGDVMRRAFAVADSHEMLDAVFARLQACSCSTLPVVYRGRLVGLVTMDNMGEFLRIEAALGRGRRS